MTSTAEFRIAYRQILNEDAVLVSPLPDFAHDPRTLIELYQWMVLVRAYDSKAIALQRTGLIGTYPSILGQEAVSVAVGHVLRAEDVFVPFYRDMGALLQRGVSMARIYQYWAGDERGNAVPHEHDDLPVAVPIGSQCLHAAGVALAMQLRAQPRVAVVSCGDGATSQGDFYEALNIAGVRQLPLVVLISNNQWAISTPLHQQTRAQTLAQKAIAAGIEGLQVDGNDVIAVRQVLQEALDKARSGQGPTVIEALTYRLSDHTTADDARRYCPQARLAEAQEKQPLARLRAYLTQMGFWDQAQEQAWTLHCSHEVNQAVQTFKTCARPSFSDAFDYHYQCWPSVQHTQKEQALTHAKQIAQAKGAAA